jgi:hypothetical protein
LFSNCYPTQNRRFFINFLFNSPLSRYNKNMAKHLKSTPSFRQLVTGIALPSGRSRFGDLPHCAPRSGVHSQGGLFFKMKRISVYIDGANFFGGLRSLNNDLLPALKDGVS